MIRQSTIELGAKYKDVVSGFEGTAVNTTLFLFACERVYLSQGYPGKDGKEIGHVFDAAQLIRTGNVNKKTQKALAAVGVETTPEKASKAKPTKTKPGGDRPTPSAIR